MMHGGMDGGRKGKGGVEAWRGLEVGARPAY
jgi:hypothetical protein